MISDRRLFLIADKSRVVEEADPAAAFLFAPPGHIIEPAEAERYGLTAADGVVVLPADASSEPPNPLEGVNFASDAAAEAAIAAALVAADFVKAPANGKSKRRKRSG